MGAVGIIGTGTMGTAMARRLLGAGHEVVVHDARATATDPLVALGAIGAATTGDLTRRCRVVITSLPGPAEVEVVATEIAGSAAPGTVHVGHSTVSVESARRVAGEAERAGIRFLDAPVSGGPMGVEAGTLAVLASGTTPASPSRSPRRTSRSRSRRPGTWRCPCRSPARRTSTTCGRSLPATPSRSPSRRSRRSRRLRA